MLAFGIPSEADVSALLALPKRVLRVRWQRDPKNDGALFLKAHCAVADNTGAVLEDVFVMLKWKPPIEYFSTIHYDFALHLREKFRVFAIDIHPDSRHRNTKAGTGRAFYGQKIDGPHRHFWSNDGGYGYAGPFKDVRDIDDVQTVWDFFCDETSIVNKEAFVHPNPEWDSPQGKLL